MKKLMRVLALGIALVMLLSSCSFSKKAGNDIGSVLNAAAVYEKDYVLFDDADEITELVGAEFQSQEGNLLYFVGEIVKNETTYPRHIVYDLDNNTTVFAINESKSTEYAIEFGEIDEFPYFVVNKTTYKLGEFDIREYVSKETTTFYDCTGAEIATFEYPVEATTVEDVLYIEGKCYRADEAGKLTEAFEYSVLSSFPEGIDAKVNNKYYDLVYAGDKGVKIYDDKFAFAKEFEIPAYADLLSVTFLKEDKLLIQYVYELDEDDKKFSFIFEGEDGELVAGSDFEFKTMTKYNLETVIYDLEEEKAKEVDCPYIISATIMGVEDEESLDYLNAEAAQALIWGYSIVDERLKGDEASVRTVAINNKNKFLEIDEINGEAVLFVNLIGEDKWMLFTASNRYLFSKGAVVGEISRALPNGELFTVENKTFFNMDLNKVYSCAENGTNVVATLNGAYLLENKKEELYFYNGGDTANKIIDDDDLETISYIPVSGDLFAVIDASDDDITCSFYNAAGNEIFDIDYSIFASISNVVESEKAALVTYTDSEGEESFYRFFKK